jgi:hypothetical protein
VTTSTGRHGFSQSAPLIARDSRRGTKLIADHWDDMLRLAGSLKLGMVQATAIMKTLALLFLWHTAFPWVGYTRAGAVCQYRQSRRLFVDCRNPAGLQR